MSKVKVWIPENLIKYKPLLKIGLHILVGKPFPYIEKVSRNEEKCVTFLLDDYAEECINAVVKYDGKKISEIIKAALIEAAKSNIKTI
ncbi:MAG: hypothetical protein AB7V00_05280 [Bacilli bacterium]